MSLLPFTVFLAADAGSVSIGIDDSAGGSIGALTPIQEKLNMKITAKKTKVMNNTHELLESWWMINRHRLCLYR